MIRIYTSTNGLKEISRIEPGCWIDVIAPNEEEIKYISEKCHVSKDFLANVLDDQETSRVETDETSTLVIVDVPYIEDKRHKNRYTTIPLGIILTSTNHFITVCLKDTEVIQNFRNGVIKELDTNKKTRFTIQLLLNTSITYLNYLNIINKEIAEREKGLSKSTQNKELLNLLDIQKSLVYFLTSLKGNDTVLERLIKGNVMPLYEGDEGILEDAIIETKQGIEMTTIYREILASMSDTYATIISNNLNGIMKFLAGITIVFSIPTMIASFMGMNVPLGIFSKHPGSFGFIVVISILLSIIIALWLKKKNML